MGRTAWTRRHCERDRCCQHGGSSTNEQSKSRHSRTELGLKLRKGRVGYWMAGRGSTEEDDDDKSRARLEDDGGMTDGTGTGSRRERGRERVFRGK